MAAQELVFDATDLLTSAAAVTPALYQYYKSRFERTLILNEDITDGIIEEIVIPLQEMDADGTGAPIHIKMNTCGGDVYTGMALCHAIETVKNCPVTVEIMGMAASMGALIAMAGRNNPLVKTVCSKYTVFLIHSGQMQVGGSTNAVRDTVQFQEQYEDLIENYVLTHSTISKEEYEKHMRHEWYMVAETAHKYGIVDEVM